MNNVLMMAHRRLQEKAEREMHAVIKRSKRAAITFDDVKDTVIYADPKAIEAELSAHIHGLLSEWLPGGSWKGREYLCSDMRGGNGKSMQVYEKADGWHWHDKANSESHGKGLINLYAAITGQPWKDAVQELSKTYGHIDESQLVHFEYQEEVDTRPKARPVPKEGLDFNFRHWELGLPSMTWDYRLPDGRLFAVVARYETPDGKQIRMWHWRHEWTIGAYAESDRLIMNLDVLEKYPDSPVVVVEGEKAAGKLSAMFDPSELVVTTWPNGSTSVGKADWSPLAGRKVILWPDADEPGLDAMQRLGSILQEIESERVSIMEVQDMPDGFDAADAISEGWDDDTVFEFIKSRKTKFIENQESDGDKKKSKKTLNIVYGDALPDDFEAPDELIEGIITRGAGTILYGESNSGKTFLALDMACAVARGEPWMDRRTEKGLVLYLASESPQSIRTRAQAYRKYHNCELPNLAIAPDPVNLWVSDEDTDKIIATVEAMERERGCKVELIIGDTLARLSAGGNENSGEDMGLVVSRMDRIRNATKAHVMLIHHSGKDQAKGARGHSSLRAAVDTEIEVRDSDTGKFATITKQRDMAGVGDRVGFALEVVEMGTTKWGKVASSCVVVPADAPIKAPKEAKLSSRQQAILDFMASQERQGERGISRKDLVHQFSGILTQSKVYEAVSKFIQQGIIRDEVGKLYLAGDSAEQQ
ncbi:AAA family ATPase [Burkholderia multivorans]|uniref:AAA family ATPase n=1 Tax=Burkholderia multivorans TaxID=87883 RepID=UPI001C2202C5|nr:AAA family ATPase [Burkholderia multivorans]MBU9259078.1 AAA family ATPase [Burkholderia multivorans]